MDKQHKQSIQVFVKKLLDVRTQDVSYETLELLSVFVIYAMEQKHCASHIELIKRTIKELSRDVEAVQELLLPLLSYIDSNIEIIDKLVNNSFSFSYDSMLHPNESINFCLSLFEEYKGQSTNNLITPRVILELSHKIADLADDAKVLDLYSRRGEWSDLLTEGMFSESLSLTDYCFEPCHFVVGSLKAKLSAPNSRQVSFNSNYDLTDIKEDYYDVVFANPSFAHMPAEFRWAPKAKIHSYFLTQAFKACKTSGRIICVVPESFLNSGGKFDRKVRKDLVSKGSLKTVIQLPSSTFSQYTKVHTAILVIEKNTEKSNVTFIDLATTPKEIQEQEIQYIVNLTKGNSISVGPPYSVISLNEIADNDFDLRVSRYPKKNVRKVLASPSCLKELIAQKEEELTAVRLKIAELLSNMEKVI